MNISLKIALRYIFPKNNFNFISIITVISIIGITIGVAALMVVMSIFNGFRHISEEMILDFDPVIRITSKNQNYISKNDYTSVINTITKKSSSKGVTIIPTLETKAVLVNKDKIAVVNLLSCSPFSNMNKESLVIGGLPSQANDILIGIALAEKLKTTIIDTIQLLSINSLKNAINALQIPVGINVATSGVFVAEVKDYDLTRCYASYQIVNRICGTNIKNLDNPVSYIDIFVKDYNEKELNTLLSQINSILPAEFTVKTWKELNADLYNVMQMERVAVFCVLSLILLIAIFNVFASIYMTIVQKKQANKILAAIGASHAIISNIYFFESVIIGIIGTTLGAILGFVFIFGQTHFQWFKLSTSMYVIGALPMQPNITEVVAVCMFSLLLSVITGVMAKLKIKSQ